MSADAHGKTMSGASAHLIASSWTSANMFRRSLALNLTRMPAGAGSDHAPDQRGAPSANIFPDLRDDQACGKWPRGGRHQPAWRACAAPGTMFQIRSQ
jgi:hypothetical protein